MRNSTPIHRPNGIDQPRIPRLYGLGAHGRSDFQGRRAGALLCWGAMRIIAGKFRSRTLAAPRGWATRPTSDRLRETLFNVLAPRFQNSPAGVAFLDLYAGTGAVGLEALSRGAKQVVFVERAPEALKALRANLEALRVEHGTFRVEDSAVNRFLRRVRAEAFDIVFLDPPYDEAEEYEKVLKLMGGEAGAPGSPNARDLGHPTLLTPDAVVVAEHRRKQKLAERYGRLERTRVLEQGDAALSFYAIGESA